MKQRLGIAQALLNRPKLLICDEPTSALDPIGRKEILDILSKVKEQTTVLFSTHILSDVERICTDVALLSDGVVKIQGRLADIKSKYRTDEYLIETEADDAISNLLEAFKGFRLTDEHRLIFREGSESLHEVLRYLSDHKISIIKIERIEPSLESLFLEVVTQ
jgi:ABC-2 type transport system ATP-binding protein